VEDDWFCLACDEALPTMIGPLPRSPLERMLCERCLPQVRSLEQPVPGYLLLREEARGGMAQVYRAVSQADESLVALKTVRRYGNQDEPLLLLRQLPLLRRLRHPSIIPVLDEGTTSSGQPFFTMEYVWGDNAEQLLERDGPLSVARAARWVIDVLDALSQIHDAGFVHLDIKTRHLLVPRSRQPGPVRLTGFDLMHDLDAVPPTYEPGSIVGTPAFMAPEQARGVQNVGPATDQYNAAATLYRLLTRAYPVDTQRGIAETLRRILEEAPAPLRSHRPEVPRPLADAVHRALAKEPAQRYPDVRAFRQALLPFAE
jgi:serine/threonine-protein kinase